MSVNQTFRGKADLTITGSLLELNFIGSTDPGNLIDLINYTVPVGFKLAALQIFITCRLETKLMVKVDAAQIGSGRTGPGVLNYKYEFQPYREVFENEIFKVECLAMSGRPATDIEAYLQARIVTI